MGNVEEQNKELFRQMYDLYNKHEMDAVYEMYSPDCNFGAFTIEQAKQFDIMLNKAFPDLKITILDMAAEGDKVAQVLKVTGTHTGESYMGIPPTNKKMDLTNTYIARIVNDKIVETVGTGDWWGLLQQLGVIPRMGEAIQAYNDSQK